MSRIAARFAKLAGESRRALIPFFTAGDPTLDATVPIMHAMVEAGADIIELGVPFSDPMADGPTIQRSSERALKNGVGLRDVLGCVARFRERDTSTPVVLMGYGNPIERMGYAGFSAEASKVGVDGVLVVDFPPEESDELIASFLRHELDPVFLLAPTSTAERIAKVGALARGYVYYVSLKGVTGAKHLDIDEVARNVASIRGRVKVPVGVGFGIRDGETARAVAAVADAVVVGSRIVEEIERSSPGEAPDRVKHLVALLRAAMDTK
jgi:tryptophan synthase alpha chain